MISKNFRNLVVKLQKSDSKNLVLEVIQSKFVTFQIGRKIYFQKSIKKWKKTLLIISVQEVRDQSGYHLSYRIVEFCSARDRSVHCRCSAGPIIPRDQTKDFS